ncbi:hypothetical protein SAMN04488509_102220 [Aquimonas voraii]|uniref:Uncharacterized protein n=1 Tax=Aquimonas voraii TaxID=265719 RepID=A0A1G6U8H8_9GAMM|nr:hypothetical protein SAMN04488509_102220 [Aquimonas voraii]
MRAWVCDWGRFSGWRRQRSVRRSMTGQRSVTPLASALHGASRSAHRPGGAGMPCCPAGLRRPPTALTLRLLPRLRSGGCRGAVHRAARDGRVRAGVAAGSGPWTALPLCSRTQRRRRDGRSRSRSRTQCRPWGRGAARRQQTQSGLAGFAFEHADLLRVRVATGGTSRWTQLKPPAGAGADAIWRFAGRTPDGRMRRAHRSISSSRHNAKARPRTEARLRRPTVDRATTRPADASARTACWPR